MTGKTKPRSRRGLLTLLLGILLAAGTIVAVAGSLHRAPASASAPEAGGSAAQDSAAGKEQQPGETPAAAGEEYRAIWITYLEYQQMDLSSEAAFRSQIATAFDQIKALGVRTVIAHVRPFGDALYDSDYFPWSHLITGTQGADPGYDPLAVMIEEAHSRALRLEALVNPYRIRGSAAMPKTLAEENPASAFAADPARADWVVEQGEGLYYNPAIPEVRALIVNGVREICENYQVDGIQFDDYFYPEGADDSFDQAAYDRLASGESRADWRRENVNALVRDTYAAIKEVNPEITFGISPQGNNDNNYNVQYSDVALWMSQQGYVDYVMPRSTGDLTIAPPADRSSLRLKTALPAGWRCPACRR